MHDSHAEPHQKTFAARALYSPWPAVLLGALVFLNTLGNQFTYDDVAIIRDNPVIESPMNLREIWLSDWWGPFAQMEADLDNPRRDRLYRPLTLFTFALNHALHGRAPAGYHLANLLLHALMCGMVWLLVVRLFEDRVLATAAALVFAVHPVHSEAVAGIVGRAEVLAALFLAAGAILLLPPAGVIGFRRTLAACGMFLLALLSKETAICYPGIALLVLHARQPSGALAPLRWWAPRAALLLIPLAVYLPLRIQALQGNLIRDRAVAAVINPVVRADGLDRILAPLTIIGHYTRQLIVPDRLISDYGMNVINPDAGADWFTLIGSLVVGAFAAALVGYFRPRGAWRHFAILAALSIVSYALISNTVLLIGVSAAERLMYWPSVPLLTMASLAALEVWRGWCRPGQPLERVAGMLRITAWLLIAGLAARTVVRNMDWHDNLTLFVRDAQTAPESFILNCWAARSLVSHADRLADPAIRAQYLDRAEAFALRAKTIAPREAYNMDVLARIYLAKGNRDLALEYARVACDLNPAHRPSRVLLDRLVAESAKIAETRIAELLERLEAHPNDNPARIELARLLLNAGRLRDALREAEQAAAIAPDDPAALTIHAELLVLTENEDQAVDVFRRVIAIRPDDWSAHANLAHLLAGRDPAASLSHARRAMELNPNDVRTHFNYAEALVINGRIEDAIRHFQLIYEGLDVNDPMRPIAAERLRDLRTRGK